MIAQYSSEHIGIEPNDTAINQAKQLYPEIQWRKEKLQEISNETGEFDFVVTWTVLQHIPPSSIQEAIEKYMKYYRTMHIY